MSFPRRATRASRRISSRFKGIPGENLPQILAAQESPPEDPTLSSSEPPVMDPKRRKPQGRPRGRPPKKSKTLPPSTVSSSSSSSSATLFLVPVDPPEPRDCVCNRGNGANDRPGNQAFRQLVARYLDPYQAAVGRLGQKDVLQQVLDVMHRQGRRMLRQKVEVEPGKGKGNKKKNNNKTCAAKWYLLSNAQARAKVGQQQVLDVMHRQGRRMLRQKVEVEPGKGKGNKKNNKTCAAKWYLLSNAQARAKVGQQLRYQMNKQSERNLPAADSHSGGDDDDDDNLGSTTKDHHPTSILDHDESLTFEMDEFSEDPSSSSGGSSSASSPWIEEPLDHHHNAAATADDLSSPEWFMSCAPMENDLSVGATKQQSSSSPPSSALLSMLPASEWCQQEEEEDEPHVTSV
eukprot:CAMPEP_0172472608 /NCGR_PEP_ID=MMETSP1065-20121228/68427_1 /TAXON_ID=265537 /ORGANISM="Amphiprora paludosa, Strain CCMP125" /LENGTH=403 /DNA_ID=CAMNT_0013230755 /DNA_START=55 /DNA_END=1266 /DNA_ORIENTATION=-